MKTLVFGEILWDIIEGTPHLGGAPLNFAAHSQRFENKATIISSVGKDNLGDRAIALVEELEINTDYIQRSALPTGTVPVEIITGQPHYEITKDVAFDDIKEQHLGGLLLEHFELFYFGTLIQRNKTSASSLHYILEQMHFRHIFYDVNLRRDSYNLDTILYSLSHCTLLKVNDEEVDVLSEMIFGSRLTIENFCTQVSTQFSKVEVIVVTLGKSGSSIYASGILHHIPTAPINVVDTVGAGDAFSAAFASTYLNTSDPIKSATIANKIGGYVASNHGPIPAYSEVIREEIKLTM
ncbi:MAG: carbohydrate kinase [Cyclobacteriaceae bacterium]